MTRFTLSINIRQKVSQPVASVADFRPISVTPIFSRITERLVTHDYFIPYIPRDCLLDQYAYKITGSTTSMLISLTDTVGRLLESNQYVRCIIIDFSKAFDTVNHDILLSKLKVFPIPVNMLHRRVWRLWIKYYLLTYLLTYLLKTLFLPFSPPCLQWIQLNVYSFSLSNTLPE